MVCFSAIEKRNQLTVITRSVVFLCLALTCMDVTGQAKAKKQSARSPQPAIPVNIREHLRVFDNRTPGDNYRMSLCADVPDNKKPLRIARQQETGHVFIILQKIGAGNDTSNRVFGFYPKNGLQTLFFKRTKSVIKDNSLREYDVEISRELTAAQFDTVMSRAIALGTKRYHMNRFNCYDYAMGIFNSVAGEHPLPVVHVRFPFIFGRGGSPCSVYKSFRQLIDTSSVWRSSIVFDELVAPNSTNWKISQP